MSFQGNSPQAGHNRGAAPANAATNAVRGDRNRWIVPVVVIGAPLGVAAWSGFLGEALALLPATIDQGWGSLIGSLAGAGIGLGAIAWQTRRGYRNMIDHQDRQAKLDREARQDQAAIQIDLDDTQRRQDAASLAGALCGELAAIHVQIGEFAQSLALQQVVYESAIEDGFGNHSALVRIVPQIDAPVFLGNAANLGLLGASHASDVAQIYAAVTAGNRAEPHEVSKRIALDLTKTGIKNADRLRRRIAHVCARLTAYINLTPDPGPLVAFDAKARAEEA